MRYHGGFFLPFDLEGRVAKTYTKLPLSCDEQLSLLAAHELTIDDHAWARNALATIRYDHLSAYWYPFRVRDTDGNITDPFEPDSRLSAVISEFLHARSLAGF